MLTFLTIIWLTPVEKHIGYRSNRVSSTDPEGKRKRLNCWFCKLGAEVPYTSATLSEKTEALSWLEPNTTNLETQEFKVQEVQAAIISSFGTELFYANQSNYTFPNLNLMFLWKYFQNHL
jgi:hypothetical protein